MLNGGAAVQPAHLKPAFRIDPNHGGGVAYKRLGAIVVLINLHLCELMTIDFPNLHFCLPLFLLSFPLEQLYIIILSGIMQEVLLDVLHLKTDNEMIAYAIKSLRNARASSREVEENISSSQLSQHSSTIHP